MCKVEDGKNRKMNVEIFLRNKLYVLTLRETNLKRMGEFAFSGGG